MRQHHPSCETSPPASAKSAVVLLCIGAAALAPPLTAQSASRTLAPAEIRDDNGHPFKTPAGSSIEPVHRLAAVSAKRDGDRRGEALADLGDRLGFWLRRAPHGSFELAGAFHGGALSRFSLEGPDNEFIEIHYRVGFLLRARIGALAARAEIYHVSSHLGDEYLERTGREPISTSREGLELLLQAAPASGLMVYGGPGFVLRTSDGLEPLSLRGGLEWVAASRAWARPYGSVELFAWSELDWEPRTAIEAGAALGRRGRIGLLLGFGPSRAEQFLRETETLIGVSVSYVR